MAPQKMKPRNFLRSGEGALANYDYTDIARGIGYVNYYGAVLDDNTDILTETIFEASGRTVGYLKTTSAKTFESTTSPDSIVFELTPEFNLPRILSGDILFSYRCYRINTNNTLTIKFYHNDDLLASKALSLPGAGETKYLTETISIPETKIKKGDVLKVEYYYTGTQSLNISYDSSSEYPMVFRVPFDLDL